METKQLTESNTVSMAYVNASPSKKLVILSAGAMVQNKEGNLGLQLLVEIDGAQKTYRPNKTTMRNLQARYGTESTNWIGKALSLVVGKVEGKDAIIGTPV